MKDIRKIGLFLCIHLFYMIATLYAASNNLHLTIHPPASRTTKLEARDLKPVSLLRAAYFHLTSPDKAEEHLQLLKAHGFNAALIADGSYALKEILWQKWGEIAAKNDLLVFAVLHFAVPRERKPLHEHYRPYVNRYGELYPKTPCPLDLNYWNAVIGERFQRLAHLSNATPIAGFVFDSEMYGSDISIYGDPCFCDLCWKAFMQAEGWTQEDLPAEQRLDFLSQLGLWDQYTAFQEQQVQTILAQIEQQVHTINPHLVFGFLGYRVNWFYTGLIRGLGTIRRPAMVFTESTYVRGYTADVAVEIRGVEETAKGEEQKRREFGISDFGFGISDLRRGEGEKRRRQKAAGRIARYIPGVWLARFFPDDLPSQLYHLATNTDGYWIYTLDSLWRETEEKRRYIRLHDNANNYWKALKNANEELNRFAKGSETYQTELPTIPLSSFYASTQRRLFTLPSLQQMLRMITKENFAASSEHPNPITYREETLFHCLNTPGGTIEITHVPIGTDPDPDFYKSFGEGIDPTRYTLFEDGKIGREGWIDPRSGSTSLEVPAGESGIVSLLTRSVTNGTRVSFSGLACVVEASSTYPLTTWNTARSYQFLVPSEKKQIKMRAYCSSKESAMLTVHSPDARVDQSSEIERFTEIRVPVSSPPHLNVVELSPGSAGILPAQGADRMSALPGDVLKSTVLPPHLPHRGGGMDEELSPYQGGTPNDDNFWTITISPAPPKPFGDIRVYLYDDEFPYLRLLNE